MSEQQLIQQAQQGNTEALALLLRQHYAMVRGYMLKLTMNPSLTDDLVQDTMLRAMEKLHTYNGKSKFSSWLITIATRLYLDRLKRMKVERRWLEQEGRLIRYQVETNQLEWSEAMEMLQQLPPEQRAAILLKHYYGYAYPEIAAIMQCSEGTVKSRVHYGTEQIRKEMKEQ
ncbi:RNA polymerase sigma factor SigY [Paenibacillus aquistagni]|uniref:RNA polymerase sigma factor n=1 Tax=Paenibacillus aquistagni TaxID=1852522 RepID=A0A1X7I2K8_9BACL|nr:RNA polymerase sigma factor SigY [Paenibacillus aquistagni]SMG08184.1 RNA polymerase, sigma subunit, SigY [Paenibacillus aquistagni]